MAGAAFLPDALEEATGLTDALIRLRNYLIPYGVRDIVYGYMLETRSHGQHDRVFAFTLPDDLMAVYYASGGRNKDPMAKEMDEGTAPILAHLEDMQTLDSGGRKSKFQFAIDAQKMGYTTILTCPVGDAERLGIGGMTFYQEARKRTPLMDSDFLMQVARAFHQSVKLNGQLGDYFGLTPKEKETLYWSAMGQTGEHMAKLAGVSTRSIELRLQSARNKLRANNTTEAVYRGVAHGILPLQNA